MPQYVCVCGGGGGIPVPGKKKFPNLWKETVMTLSVR